MKNRYFVFTILFMVATQPVGAYGSKPSWWGAPFAFMYNGVKNVVQSVCNHPVKTFVGISFLTVVAAIIKNRFYAQKPSVKIESKNDNQPDFTTEKKQTLLSTENDYQDTKVKIPQLIEPIKPLNQQEDVKLVEKIELPSYGNKVENSDKKQIEKPIEEKEIVEPNKNEHKVVTKKPAEEGNQEKNKKKLTVKYLIKLIKDQNINEILTFANDKQQFKKLKKYMLSSHDFKCPLDQVISEACDGGGSFAVKDDTYAKLSYEFIDRLIDNKIITEGMITDKRTFLEGKSFLQHIVYNFCCLDLVEHLVKKLNLKKEAKEKFLQKALSSELLSHKPRRRIFFQGPNYQAHFNDVSDVSIENFYGCTICNQGYRQLFAYLMKGMGEKRVGSLIGKKKKEKNLLAQVLYEIAVSNDSYFDWHCVFIDMWEKHQEVIKKAVSDEPKHFDLSGIRRVSKSKDQDIPEELKTKFKDIYNELTSNK